MIPKTLAQELQPSPIVARKLRRTTRADIIVNTLGGLFGALAVVACVVVAFEGSLGL